MASSRSSKSSRNSNQKRTNQNDSPSKIRWRQILLGFLLGIIATVAFNYYIERNQALLSGIELPIVNNSDEAVDKQDPDEIDYDFFEMLPKQNVEVDVGEPTKATHHYFLQVGSYQKKEDAEARRVQLILLNLSPEIEAATVNKVKVYRVITGPYAKKTLMSKARSQLITNGIKPLLLKREIKP